MAAEWTGRFDALLHRAQALQSQMERTDGNGSAVGGSIAAQSTAFAKVPHRLSDGAKAAFELIMAEDPLLSDVKGCNSAVDKVFHQSSMIAPLQIDPETSMACVEEKTLHPSTLGSVNSLRISVGTVRILQRFVPLVRECQSVMLRYVVPACPRHATHDEDVVTVACRDISPSGTVLVFNQSSVHSMRLEAESFSELTTKPISIELLLEGISGTRKGSKAARGTFALGMANVSWHGAILDDNLTCRHNIELASREQGNVGRIHLSISLLTAKKAAMVSATSPNNDAAIAHPDMHIPGISGKYISASSAEGSIHLRVWLGKVRLQGRSLQGVQAILKMGLAQEVCIRAIEESVSGTAVGRTGLEVHGAFGSACTSGAPVWKVDPETGECVEGPVPSRIFIQFWHAAELLGLIKIPLSQVEASVTREVVGACGCICLLDSDLEVKSASTGGALGVVHVLLHAGMLPALTCVQLQASEFSMHAGTTEDDTRRRALTSGILVLAAAHLAADDIAIACHGSSIDAGSWITLEKLHLTLLQLVDGLTSHGATAIVRELVSNLELDNPQAVNTMAACNALSSMSKEVEAAVDSLVREAGDACSTVVCDLHGLGCAASLQRSQLASLFRRRGVDLSWDAMETFFKSLRGDGSDSCGKDAEVLAPFFANVFEHRAETYWREIACIERLEQKVVSALRQLAEQDEEWVSCFLRSFAREKDKIDRLALVLALSDLLITSSNPGAGGQVESLSRKELESVAWDLMRRFGNAHEEVIEVDKLLAWLLPKSQCHSKHDNAGTSEKSNYQTSIAPASLRSARQNAAEPPKAHSVSSSVAFGPTPSAKNEGLVIAPVHATVQMGQLLSETDVSGDFASLFASCLATALGISLWRVRVLGIRAGSAVVCFEIAKGPVEEISSAQALKDCLSQLADPASKLLCSDLSDYISGTAPSNICTSGDSAILTPRREIDIHVASTGIPDSSLLSQAADLSQLTDGTNSTQENGLPCPDLAQTPQKRRANLASDSEARIPGITRSVLFELPACVVFAFLDVNRTGHVKACILQELVQRCFAVNVDDAAIIVTDVCDSEHCLASTADCKTATYSSFNVLFNQLKTKLSTELSAQERLQRSRLRRDVCVALDLVRDQSSLIQSNHPHACVQELLVHRGHSLATTVSIVGLAELLKDAGLPFHVASPLVEWDQMACSLRAQAAEHQHQVVQSNTFHALLDMLQYSAMLLRTHLDSLFRACFARRIDLSSVVSSGLQHPPKHVISQELFTRLESVGVQCSNVHQEDVIFALDPRQEEIGLPMLLEQYSSFCTRQNALLEELRKGFLRSHKPIRS